MRCKSPHLCRNAANGGCRDELKDPSPSPRSRSMTPEDRGRSPTMQEKLARWPKVDNLEKERLGRAWSMMERERRAISDTRDALLMEAGKGSSAMWRQNRRVEEIMADLRETLCDNCREEGRAHEREQCGSRSVRAPSTEREQRGPQPAQAHSANGSAEPQ